MSEANLAQLHKLSFRNKERVQASAKCGCFYCLAEFAPSEIVRWTDGDRTAMCPKCSIDSVLPDSPSTGVLKQMQDLYFGPDCQP